MRKNGIGCLLTIFLLFTTILSAQQGQFINWKDYSGKVYVQLVDGMLQISPMAANAVRIQYQKSVNRQLPEWIYIDSLSNKAAYQIKDNSNEIRIKLSRMSVIVNKQTGQLTFRDSQGKKIFSENQRKLTPSLVQGENTYCAELHIESPEDEFLFGLGQFQDGYLNVRGLSRRLTQVNTQISIPFVLSNKGYGLLWNNYGLTDFNPSEQKIIFQKQEENGEKTVVDVTSTEGDKKEVRQSNIFISKLTLPKSGRYALLLDVGQKMARTHHLAIDGKTIVEVKNIWLPPTTSVIVDLEAGEHQVMARLEKDDRPVLFYKEIENETVFRSPVAEYVDYTVFIGNANEVITTYRKLTGNAPMMPSWALGYIHCRERFHSQGEILETVQKFRKEKLPVDMVVQDWQYWGKYGWNAMRFDESDYPDPKVLVDSLHAMNTRLMLSVWSKIDSESKIGQEMKQKGYYLANTSWVDFFNSDAASCYWMNFSKNLLKPYGIDAWWQDATEPENDDLLRRKVMNGTVPGEVFRNVYPLLVNRTVYQGCRKDDPSRRTMILTRSGFPGIQRYGAAVWSGDVGHDWETFRRQIVGGLNMMASGIPWWTYDAGGFFRPQDQYTDKKYHERFLRWLQTATFLPLMRVHGYQTNTEFWNYGEQVTRIARKSLELRYRLFPYIYSESARVSLEASTLMRPMIMDYGTDSLALIQKYEFMFGPSLLVAPIVEENPAIWHVYLPENKGGWYDFFTGKKMHVSSGTIDIPVSLENIPVFVKAGTILPLAENCQHTGEVADVAWEIRIYQGADGKFIVYEDEGTNNQYEQGKYATFCMEWNDNKNKLILHSRQGSYSGMCKRRKLKILKISADGSSIGKEVMYEGKKIAIKF